MSVLVIRSRDIDEARTFFEQMGLTFVKEQHGNGPEHYACQIGDNVLELYPTRKDGMTEAKFM